MSDAGMSDYPRSNGSRRDIVRTPEEVAVMQELHRQGVGIKRIAQEIGCNPRTVHVAAILGERVVQVPGRMAEKVVMLVHGAALDPEGLAPQRGQGGLEARGAVHDHELGPPEPAGIEIVEVRAERGRRCGRVSCPNGARPRRSRRPCSSRKAAPSARRGAGRWRPEPRCRSLSCRGGP